MLMTKATSSLSGADRARRYRERQQAGLIVVSVEVAPEDLTALIEYGLLEPQNSADRSEVGEAIETLLCALCESAVDIDSQWYADVVDGEEGVSA